MAVNQVCLKDFKWVKENLTNCRKSQIMALHKVVFEEEGDRKNRQRLRDFEGFVFNEGDKDYKLKGDYMRNNLTKAELISVCCLLGLNCEQDNLIPIIIKNLLAESMLEDVKDDDQDELEDVSEDESEENDGVNKTIVKSKYPNEEEAEDEVEAERRSCVDVGSPQNDDLDYVDERMLRRRMQPRFALNFRDIEDSIKPFDGRSGVSIEDWVQEFEETAAVYYWDDMQMLVFAKKSLTGLAKQFVLGEKGLITWSKLKKALLNEFKRRINSRQVHKMLTDRSMQKNETVMEYLYTMKDIASEGNVVEKDLILYVIDGIKDLNINKQMLYGARNLREFKEKIRDYEEFNMGRTAYDDKRKKDTQTTNNNNRRSNDHGTGAMKKREAENGALKCFNCGDKGHISSNCPSKAKGVKCFRCNEFGHVAIKCPSMPKNTCVISIDKKYRTQITICNYSCEALVDTGSELSLIRIDEYERIGSPKLREERITFKGVGSSVNMTMGEFTTTATTNGIEVPLILHVVDRNIINYGVILGTNFIDQVELNISKGVMTFSRREEHTEDDKLIPFIYKIDIQEENNDLSYITDSFYRDKIADAIQSYTPLKTKDVGIQTKIILKSDVPVAFRPRRLSPLEKNEVEKQIKVWLNEGVIRHSSSEYASPIVLVKKKNGSTRICVDYRQVNKLIERPRFPLPLIEDQLDALQGSKIFSSIDLRNGFFHVPMAKGSEKYTAFVTPTGHYEFLKTPFGLAISPAIFQKFINAVFKDLIEQKIVVTYMDDVIILAQNEDQAVERLKITLNVAASHALQINWNKCCFLQSEIEYLGHIVSGGMIKPSLNKTEAVMKFPIPSSVKKVQSFLGLTGYFRKFIPQYSMIARPLTNLLKNDVVFEFGNRELEAFATLKKALANKPVLRLYKLEAETELHTDASRYGYGMILMQKDDEDQKFHPVYYASGKTTTAEENYTSYELEVLAIVKALRKFRVYLLGISFKIITDCQAFAMTMKKKDLSVRVARWALLLEEFSYDLCHRPGSSMKHVDALSRSPLPNVLIITENDDCMLMRLKKAQLRDDDLRKLMIAVENDENNDYTIRNGVLYKKNNDDFLIVVPKEMQIQVTRRAHERGHFGVTKTEEIVKQDFWFDKLREKVEGVVASCLNCILAERKQGKQEGLLNPINKGEYPLDSFHIDHIGPMTLTKKKYQYILVVVDSFTKFVWLFPAKSTDAVAVVESLKKLSVTFGNPRRIISDRGSAFTSGLFKEYCQEEGIEHVLITTGVPRSNGQVERVNRVIIPLLTKLAAPVPENWFKFVDVAQKCLNNTTSRATGRAPFQLMFGTNMRIKDEAKILELLENEWVCLFEEERNELRRNAKQKIQILQESNRMNYNKNRKNARKYQKGDLVAIKRTQFGPGLKLHGKYLGPYEIVHVMRNDRYAVEKRGQQEGPRNTTTTADFMKPWAIDPGDVEELTHLGSDADQDGRMWHRK